MYIYIFVLYSVIIIVLCITLLFNLNNKNASFIIAINTLKLFLIFFFCRNEKTNKSGHYLLMHLEIMVSRI